MFWGGFCYTISYLVGPGIVHSGGKQLIAYGALDHEPSEKGETLAAIINATGEFTAEHSPNIQSRMWEKFTGISSTGAVGTLTRLGVGEWRDIPETRKLFQTVLREAFALAKARGIILGEDIFQLRYEILDSLPKTFKSSMQRDIEAGKRSELMQQIGYIVREGARLGVPVPTSATIYAALLPQELLAQNKQ